MWITSLFSVKNSPRFVVRTIFPLPEKKRGCGQLLFSSRFFHTVIHNKKISVIFKIAENRLKFPRFSGIIGQKQGSEEGGKGSCPHFHRLYYYYYYNILLKSRHPGGETMKFVCDGITLSEAVLKASKACAVRTTAPIMECIKITAGNDEVSFLATDGELSILKKIQAEVFDEGEICVPGKLFSDFIGKLGGQEVTISTGENGMEIRYGDSNSFMQVMNAEEFPKINFQIGENSFVLKQKDLKKIVSETVFCCASDDSRPILKGCLLEIKDKLEATALDGYRLALSAAPLVSKTGELSVICPARTLNEISRLLSDDEKEITLYTQGGMMMVELDGMIIVSRLFLGDFIRKENVIPVEFATKVTFDGKELAASAERAAVLIRGNKDNLITLEIRNNAIRLSSVSEFGNVSESVPCTIEGKELSISMNAKYLLDSLKALGEEKVVMSLNSPLNPFILQSGEQKDILYLILPVRSV